VIDAKAKTFTHKNKDGKEVKHLVTSKTEINNGDKSLSSRTSRLAISSADRASRRVITNT
jgi:hypothetical protein